jgi:hypothetical protein
MGGGDCQHDPLRPVRTEGGQEGGLSTPFLQPGADGHEEAAAGLAELGSELSNICAYYKTLIAAARGSLSATDAAAVIRRLQDEKTRALRNATDRHHAARENQHRARKPASTPSRTSYPGRDPS